MVFTQFIVHSLEDPFFIRNVIIYAFISEYALSLALTAHFKFGLVLTLT